MTVPLDAQTWRKYRPIAEIGRGGMADVSLAVAQGPAGFTKLVVIKRARVALTGDGEIVSMFLDEARLAARLNHPNVVQTYEVGEDGERYFIAMEYLDGQPLSQVRGRAGHAELPLALQARILSDALAGLHYAHDLPDFDGTPLGVVHRDVSPQNLFVTYDGLVKVVDFGIAKVSSSSFETRTGVLKGKVGYMSPEQARAERVDRRSDIYSVGVILWEAIAGRRMWKGFSDIGILTRLSKGDLPDLRETAPGVNPEIERICLRALALAPEDRYATAAEFQDEIERWLVEQNKNVTGREVGAFVAKHFVEDRASIKKLIEEQLSELRCSGSYPRAPLSEPAHLPQSYAAPMSRTSMRPSSPNVATSSTNPTASAIEASQRVIHPPGRLRAPIAIALAFLVVGSVVGFGFYRTSRVALPANTARTIPNEEPPLPVVSASAPGEVHLVIRVSPAQARLSLDGAPLAAGAFAGRLPRDGNVHRIRAEAPGFVTQEEQVTASSDVILSLALQREPAAPAAANRPRPQAPAPAAAQPSRSAPANTAPAVKRGIDITSPYAR